MNIKLIESLREELSGIYGGGMYGNLNKNPYN
jgi:zinc protease